MEKNKIRNSKFLIRKEFGSSIDLSLNVGYQVEQEKHDAQDNVTDKVSFKSVKDTNSDDDNDGVNSCIITDNSHRFDITNTDVTSVVAE